MKAPDLYDLRKAVDAGLVSCQKHPTAPYLIWNYTPDCAMAGAWDATTLQCRGLVTDEDGVTVARPFPKFFNYGEPLCPVTSLTGVLGHVEISDKLDGSLGVIYPMPDGTFAVATRGSFTSNQAVHATKVLNGRYPKWKPPVGVTVLVEIIYPENRIVLDYGGMDDLVYICAIKNETGADVLDDLVAWPGPMRTTYQMSFNRLLEEIETPNYDANREGFVLTWPRSDAPALRVKLKYASYVGLHRVVTGLSTRSVWEALRDGAYDDFIAVIPDSWKAAVQTCADDLIAQYVAVMDDAKAAVAAVADLSDRAAQARVLLAEHRDHASLAFALLDGKGVAPSIWRRVEPRWRPIGWGDPIQTEA